MISVALRNLCNRIKPVDGFEIHACLDGNIFLDQISGKIVDSQASLLVLVPIRLGIDSIQAAYLTQIKSLFQFESNVGIAGGRDREAYFLVGLDNAELGEDEEDSTSFYYLDPHMIQRSVPADWRLKSAADDEVVLGSPKRTLGGLHQAVSTYHCSELRTLDAPKMCNSLAAGFYLRDAASFDMWAQHLKQMGDKYKDKFIFTVFETEPELPRRFTEQSRDDQEKEANGDMDDSFEDLEGFQVVDGD
jgi:cysteine protease ATG4